MRVNIFLVNSCKLLLKGSLLRPSHSHYFLKYGTVGLAASTSRRSAQVAGRTMTTVVSRNMKRPIYFDYQATTPVDPRVHDAMLPFFVDMYGNPHSRSHSFGWEAEKFVEEARGHIASLVGAKSRDVIFTSGATESNNNIIKGVAAYHHKQSPSQKKHIITTQIEHKCVLASCRDVQEQFGWDVTYLEVERDGLISLEKLEKAIRPNTVLVSIMHVNNEIGVIQPLQEIGRLCHSRNVLFHSDAAQGIGKVPIAMYDMNIDFLSMSGHKLYGPKGIGAMIIRTKVPRIRLVPLFSGGGQERGLRSGTLPAPLIVGLGKAAQIAQQELENDKQHVEALFTRLHDRIVKHLPKVTLNGSATRRYKGNLNLSFEAVEGESLLMSLTNVAISSGSACTSASLEPSYVLRAIGVGEDLAHTSIRFGFGRFSMISEIDACADAVIKNVTNLREMSPLWVPDGGKKVDLVWT